MTDIRIVPFTKIHTLDALRIVLQTRVGPKTRALRFFRQSLKRKRDNIFLAAYKGKPVGIIGWYMDDGTWAGRSLGTLFPYGKHVYWVSFFAVYKPFRGKGIGIQLMKHLIKKVKQLQAKELWVYTERAKGFYEKLGFRFIARAIIERKYHDFLKYTYD